ncbi:cobalamin-binding protein [Stutzerimonas kirkiae]|uniref:Cobalamin-binding protein n=1 Tax=Stutzerimonas kirkiae TaxID=2211392 RepID=A0A4Q9R5H3_9GAMM|nr:cobalamin-binding protein [Stutzerimonas kirkiae]TBU94578.1 cobalamin-binding protein [Stutzerimonas kirkiae]TBV00737.1 cobalamin-binding protein [Stutzerimonas kirkiae]TBV04334.1 cobalamin-binding protein [Stutzerimonas kirkiae]TBV12734.1 cobalamin-binding protein [Stutzerimonas kirkiae]
MRIGWLLFALCLPVVSVAAERVISLAPSLSEIVLELDAAGQLVGMFDGGDRPAALADVPSVGRIGQLEMETLLALEPTLVLLWPDSVSQAQLRQLRQFGVEILVARPDSLERLAQELELIGARLGRADKGQALARRLRERVAQLRQLHARERPWRVFYQIWDKPLYTVGGRQIISEAIAVCGGRNVFEDLPVAAPQVSVEAVLARDPEVILAGSDAQLDGWKAWPRLAAVREGRLLQVPDKGLERPSFQMLGAIERLCDVMR